MVSLLAATSVNRGVLKSQLVGDAERRNVARAVVMAR
jgi:hypothetical protein